MKRSNDFNNIITEATDFVNDKIKPIIDKDKKLFSSSDSYSFFVSPRLGMNVNEKALHDQLEKDLRDTTDVSVYIHFPYCESKCKFCHYVSYADGSKNELREKAIDFILKELEIFKQNIYDLEKFNISSLYIGGGTPSLISCQSLIKLFKAIGKLPNDCEITIEATPESLSESQDKIQLLSDSFNRISVGIQTLDENILKNMQRKFDKNKIITNLASLFDQASRNNIKTNVDFIYGFPFVSNKNNNIKRMTYNFLEDLEEIVSLNGGPDSITLYRLRLKRVGDLESLLMKDYEYNPSIFPNQTEIYQMKYAASIFLGEKGYQEGPVGWFLKRGNSVKVYSDRWKRQIPLLGFGLSAYSYTDNLQYRNVKEYETYQYYLNLYNQLPIGEATLLSDIEKSKRKLSFLLKQNMPFELNWSVGENLISDEIRHFIQEGFLVKTTDDMWELSDKGRLLVEELITGYIWDDGKIICSH